MFESPQPQIEVNGAETSGINRAALKQALGFNLHCRIDALASTVESVVRDSFDKFVQEVLGKVMKFEQFRAFLLNVREVSADDKEIIRIILETAKERGIEVEILQNLKECQDYYIHIALEGLGLIEKTPADRLQELLLESDGLDILDKFEKHCRIRRKSVEEFLVGFNAKYDQQFSEADLLDFLWEAAEGRQFRFALLLLQVGERTGNIFALNKENVEDYIRRILKQEIQKRKTVLLLEDALGIYPNDYIYLRNKFTGLKWSKYRIRGLGKKLTPTLRDMIVERFEETVANPNPQEFMTLETFLKKEISKRKLLGFKISVYKFIKYFGEFLPPSWHENVKAMAYKRRNPRVKYISLKILMSYPDVVREVDLRTCLDQKKTLSEIAKIYSKKMSTRLGHKIVISRQIMGRLLTDLGILEKESKKNEASN